MPTRIETTQLITTCGASNAVSGYALRVTEELILKKKTTPLSAKEVENGINSILSEFGEEHVVKNISTHMSNKTGEKRILFTFYLQADNKYMNYFLDKPMLERWFAIILQNNAETTLERYRDAFSKLATTPKKDMVIDLVLNDIVFGYCVRLSESLFPIAQ